MRQRRISGSIIRSGSWYVGCAFVGRYIPLQQHVSNVLPVSSQTILPSFCIWQQHVLTSLPVNVHTIHLL
jgi:hypothetical protein